LFSFHYHGLEA